MPGTIDGRKSGNLWRWLQKLPDLAAAAHEARIPSLGQMADDVRIQSSTRGGEPLNWFAEEIVNEIISVIERVLWEVERVNGQELPRGNPRVGRHGIAADVTSKELHDTLTDRVILIEIWCPAGRLSPDFTALGNAELLFVQVRRAYHRAATAYPVETADYVPRQPSRPCPLECGGRVRLKYRDNSNTYLHCGKCKTEFDIDTETLEGEKCQG